MNPPPMVRVVWNDAQSDADDWTPLEHLDGQPCIVTTVGHLLAGRPGHVSVGLSWYLADDEMMVGNVLHIPEAMVLAMDSLISRPA